ncbi:DNA polymerase zeta catalytic subunit isoform X2 [Rhipicephalus microplus]|uniref:DNA polymerase zeta catalytic subunit isoform X2 n=1 Tax=Rhipicephalus microplus TaxID=6941 RepID=UPI003F6BB042
MWNDSGVIPMPEWQHRNTAANRSRPCPIAPARMFALRLVTLDYYLAAPSAPLDPLVSKLGGWEVWQVPVLRIFGVTPAGQKACLHVHGALPYLTVPCSEPRPERFAVVLASEIDLLLNTAAGRATSMHRHVHHVAVFRGTRLYGFHDREETFLRIYLYNPLHVPKVAELLLSGHVLKQIMQPHEAHIPYALQFMVDHNLHGMSFVRVELFKFRRPLSWAHDDRSRALGSGPGIWSLRNLPVELFGDLEKQTTCELELDCCAKDILNANEKDVLSPGLAALWQEEEDRRQEPVSWEPLSLEEDSFPPTESEQFYLARLDKLLSRPVVEEQDQTGFGKQPRKKHHSSLLDTSHGILDSQDEALAEALAQAASSWQRSGVEEEDSILGSLSTPDNVVDDDDDNDVEDMTQVFQLAGEREQDDADSSMSDHSDGNEAYDPFQLDGADDQPVGVRKTAATTTRDQGTQTGARPPVLVRQLLGRARARRFTRLSLRRQQQQQQQHSQMRKQERSPAKRTGAEGPHRPGEAPGSSPPVAEDWQRWQSCCVASMLMAPGEGGSTPSGEKPNQSPSLPIRSHESSSHLLDALRPCFIQLSRLTEQEMVRWRHQEQPEGRRRWSLRDLNKSDRSGAAPDVSKPKSQCRKRGLSTESSASSQQRASARGRRGALVNSVLPHSEQFTNVETRSVEPAHRTRRASYSSASEDGQVLHRHAKAKTRKASKRVKVAAESFSSDRTLREREVGKKADKNRPAEALANAGGDAESLDFCAAAATADLSAELRVPSAKERVPHSRQERKLSSKRQLAVEVIESVPDSGTSSSSSSSHLVNKPSDPDASVSRPSIICRIRIQGKHGVISTTSTRPRVVGFVSPDKSTTESCVADLGSPPTLSVSESSSSTVVGAQMSDGPVPAATSLSPEVTNHGDSLKIKVSKRNKSSSATPEATETQLRSPERVYTSTESLATHLSPEVVDPVEVSKCKVSKKSQSNIVTPEAAVVQLENSEAVHTSDASSLATSSNSEVADSGMALRRPKRSKKGQASSATTEEPAVQSESTKDICVGHSLESAATPSTSELADSGTTLRTKLYRKSKSSDMTPEAPAVQLENSQLAPVSDASASLATHLSSELVDSGIVLRHPRKSKSNTVTPEAPAANIESAEASCASNAATAVATSLSMEVSDFDGVGLPKSSWKSKLRTAASDTCDGHLETCEAGHVLNTHQSDPTTLSTEVTDHGASLRVKFSRRSSSSKGKPEIPIDKPKSSEAAHMSNASNPVAIPLRSDMEDSGVLSRPKRSRKSEYGTVTAEAAGTDLESSQVGHVPDSVTFFSGPSSAERANAGTVSRSKSSRKSKSSITTAETLLESSQANAMPDVATSRAIPMCSEVADSNAKLRRRSSRKNKSNVVMLETPKTHLESFKTMLSGAPPTAAEPKASEAATRGLPSRRNTRSARDVGPRRTRLASTCSSGKSAEFPEPVCSGPASIENIYDEQLVPVMGGQDAIIGTSQSSSDVDAIQEPENVLSVSRPARRKRIVSLCSSSDSQDATNIPSDDSTARPGNELRATTRRTRRQAAGTKLSLRHVGATRSSSAESVTSTSSFEVLSKGHTEMSLPKQEILSKQASGVEEKSYSKVAVRRSRARGNSASASLSCSTESTNDVESGTTSAVQEAAQTVKPKEVRRRSSPRIFANKLALRRKVREEDNEGKLGALELQNNKCLVIDASDSSPALDVGVASKATTGVATSNVSPFDSASCSTSASFANLASNRTTTTRLVSSGLQVTSSSMPNEGILKPGAPEAVGPHEHPVLGAPRLGTPSGKREVEGLPIRSSKSRKKAVLPEAPDPQIQELLVTYERLTITTPSELSVDDSVGSKQPAEAAGSADPPQKSSPSKGSDSVENEDHQRYESNREPEAEHLKELSNSSNLVDTRESDILKSSAPSSRGGAADAGDLTKEAPKGVQNRPDSILEPVPVPSCPLSEPGTTDADTLSSHLNTAREGLGLARELETSLLYPKQRQCDVTDSDALLASSDIPLSDVTMIEPNIELEAPEEVNVRLAASCDLAAVNASTNVNLDAGQNGPKPVESVQEDSSVISVGKAELSELTAKPGVSCMAHTNAPADELLSSNRNKLLTTSHSSPLSTSSTARREPLTSPMGNSFDSSGSSTIGTAVEHCGPHVTSPIEQSSSQTLDGRQAVSECPAADVVTELNASIESGQKAREDCTEKATDSVRTPEPVSIPCGQKEHKFSTVSSDDVQVEAELSSCICADNEQAAASQERAVDSNSAEVSSADDDDFLCLSPDGDDEWILLDEVRDDSVELFPSPKGSIAAQSDESCGDDTVVENIASASDVNLIDIGVCKKATTADDINDVGGTSEDAVGHLSGASSEKGVCYEGSLVDSVENSGKESRSKKSVASVFRESSIGNSCEPNCGSHDENANSIDSVTSVAGDECVVDENGESCPEAASSMENFEISNETLASNSCGEIFRNFDSDSSMIDVGREHFLNPCDNDECTEKMAKGDYVDLTSADFVQDMGSENCVGDNRSEGAEFIASENFIEDIGSEESMEVFSGTDCESKQHKKEAVIDEISSDSRQHEDTCAIVAVSKSVQVVVERLDDIDPRSAIGMLYCKAKNALKYSRAPCKVAEIAENKHKGKPDNSQARQAGTEKRSRTVGRSTARKSPVSHRQALGLSKSLHKDVRAPSSQTAPKYLQVLDQSPREQDSSVQLVSAEKAPTSNQKTFKSSKTSHKGLLASGNQLSLGDSQAERAKAEEQDGDVAPFSGDKPSSVRQASKSSKSLHKDHRNARSQHFVKSADESEAKPTGPKKKDGSGNRLSVNKSFSSHQIASKSFSQDVKFAKNKDSDTTIRKPEALRPFVKKRKVGVVNSSLERSVSRDQEALKSSKTSHRAFNVAKKKDSAASASKADAQQPNKEKLADIVDSSSVGESPSDDQKASKPSKTSHRIFKVTRKKESVASLGKAQAQQLNTEKQSDSVDHSSVQELPCHDQAATKSSKTSHQAFKVTKNKENAASASKAEAQRPGIDKQNDTVDSSVGELPSHDQEASISCKTSNQALKVAKNKDSVTTLGKTRAQQLSTEKQGDNADRSSVIQLPCHDQAASKSSKTSHQAFKVTKGKDNAASASKAEAQWPGIDKQRDTVDSSVGELPSHDQEASISCKTSNQALKVAKNKDSVTTLGKTRAQQLSTENQGDNADRSSVIQLPCHDQAASKSSKTSHQAFKVTKGKDNAASASKAEAQWPGIDKQRDTVDSSVGELPSHDQEAPISCKTSNQALKVAKNKESVATLGKAQAQQPSTEKQGESADRFSVLQLPCHDQATSKSSETSHRAFKVTKNKGSAANTSKAEAQQPGISKQRGIADFSSVGESPSHIMEASKSFGTSHQALKVAKNKDSVATLGKTQARQPSFEKQGDSADHSSAQELPCPDQAALRSSKTSQRAFKVIKNKGSAASASKAEAQQPKLEDTVDCSSVVELPSHEQKALKPFKTTHRAFKVTKNKDSATSPCKAQAQQLSIERQGDSADHSSVLELPCHDQVSPKFSKISCHDVNVDKTKDSSASPKKAEAEQAVMEKQVDSVDPLLFDKSQSHDQESFKSSKTFCQDFEVAENKGSHTSPNKTEAHQKVTEKQGDNADPFLLEKSSSLDQQVSRSSGHLNKDISTCGNEVPVCVNGEPRPDNLENEKVGGHVEQQDECVEPLQIAKSETLPTTDMGKVPGLLDQVLDLGELPDAIKCLLDSEVPLPELDADCFSLPPDSTRWLSEDGMVEKRKPDERPQNSKEDSASFCPSSDIELGEFKACSLTNEGLVALVPAVPPPTCGPHFNSPSTPRVRKKCLRGLAHWQKTKLEAFARDSCFEVDFEHNPELRIAFCRDRSVVLTPARSAPTVSLLAPTLQLPPPSPDDDVASVRELPASDASTDPAMLLVSPPSTPPRLETSTSQLDGPTCRFALSGARLPADTERVLTVLSLEVHVRTRSDLRPDPDYDPVQCVLWCARGYGVDAPLEAGAMHWCSVGDPRQVDMEDLVGASLYRTGVATTSLRTQVVRSELDLLHAVVELVHRWDPDVLLGYDVERASWGYLCDRAERLDLDLYARLSRAPPPPGRKDILGRILLCAWRILRKEVALNIYTFENTYFHVMHRRVPLYSFRLLSEWFSKDLFRWRTVEHYALRARGNLELLDELNVFGKTSQMARIFGIQFYEVLSRGSQFRVESMLLRLARSHRMVALSASTAQRARQRAPEFIPLVLEPRAQLYTDPVVVLDFQSLYPSVIISHNYCFSTCLGRVENLGSSAPFGCSSLEVPLQYVKSLRDHITVSPAGVAFVKPSIRRGLLPQMLDEVLGTRIMVKKAMSQCANKGLYRVLDAQQLSLKLIANVTYGYTAAGFSGRMPCVEVADSVVSKGREALEQAIRTAEATVPGARVVYGDTDSLFVLLEGRSREEAFRLGQEIADRVTAQNPRPMRLKLEKVYQPCVLQTKKRYVGFSYESPDQQEPKYDAKGIETVRRDTCPAVAKLLEKMLRVLFTSRDMVPVKRFVKLQFSKILAERVSPQDFIFAREFRGLHGYQPSACVPALEIARRQLRRDPRAEPLVGERVPYVVVYGHPGQRLIELVRSPLDLLSGQLRINAHYYVARVIGPALNRVLRLLGADCLQWYEELPRPRFVSTPRPGTMAAYVVVNQLCLACGGQAESRQLCASCEADPAYAALILGGKVQRVQKALLELQTVCHSCMGFQAGSVCLSVDCPVLFKTSRVTTEAQQALEWNRARNDVPASSS